MGVHVHRAHLDVRRIIENLEFGSDLPQVMALVFHHPVEDPAVCDREHLEVQNQFKILELPHGDNYDLQSSTVTATNPLGGVLGANYGSSEMWQVVLFRYNPRVVDGVPLGSG